MPPSRSDTITLPRSYVKDTLAATRELGEALGAAAEVVERAEATILQAKVDRDEFVLVLRDTRDTLSRVVDRLDTLTPAPPPPPQAADPKVALVEWARTKHGQAALSGFVLATAAVLAGISALLGYNPAPLFGASP